MENWLPIVGAVAFFAVLALCALRMLEPPRRSWPEGVDHDGRPIVWLDCEGMCARLHMRHYERPEGTAECSNCGHIRTNPLAVRRER